MLAKLLFYFQGSDQTDQKDGRHGSNFSRASPLWTFRTNDASASRGGNDNERLATGGMDTEGRDAAKVVLGAVF